SLRSWRGPCSTVERGIVPRSEDPLCSIEGGGLANEGVATGPGGRGHRSRGREGYRVFRTARKTSNACRRGSRACWVASASHRTTLAAWRAGKRSVLCFSGFPAPRSWGWGEDVGPDGHHVVPTDRGAEIAFCPGRLS